MQIKCSTEDYPSDFTLVKMTDPLMYCSHGHLIEQTHKSLSSFPVLLHQDVVNAQEHLRLFIA